MKLRYFLVLLVLISTLVLTGCDPARKIEGQIIHPDLLAADYLIKANQTLTIMMQELQGYKVRHLNILRGEYPKEKELAALEKSIDEAQKKIEEFTVVRSPAIYNNHQEDMLENLNNYKISLMYYRRALEGGIEKDIRMAAAGFSAQFSAINSLFLIR